MQSKQIPSRNWHGWEVKVDGNQGIAPIFSKELKRRVNKKLANNTAVVGEAGIGKSYLAIQLARVLDPKMTPRQVVFTYSEYLDVLTNLRMGKPIVFDEPSYAMGKREWYKEVNQALIKTLESQRFMVKPLFISVININLLDKTIRNYLLQYQVLVYDRGKARVYRLSPSQHQDKTYYIHFCNLQYGLMDGECGIDSCLDCKKLESCQAFRAQYEKKKIKHQLERYKQDQQLALQRETKNLTMDQLAEKAILLKEHFMNDNGTIDVKLLRIVLRDEGIYIGHNKSYNLKTLLEYRYPEIFSK